MFIHDDKLPIALGAIAPDPALAPLISPLIAHMMTTATSLLCMRSTMPWPDAQKLIICAATGALNQFELLLAVTASLTRNAAADEIRGAQYIRRTASIDAGMLDPMTSGDPVTDIHLCIARAQHARTMCDNALRLIGDTGAADAVRYVRAQQINAACSFGGLLTEIDDPYACNPAFDVCKIEE